MVFMISVLPLKLLLNTFCHPVELIELIVLMGNMVRVAKVQNEDFNAFEMKHSFVHN